MVTIEQTETPAMLAERKKKDSRCKDTVVKREKIAVVTRGTMIDRVMVESCPDASHVLAISEFPSGKEGRSSFHIGVCAAECALVILHRGFTNLVASISCVVGQWSTNH